MTTDPDEQTLTAGHSRSNPGGQPERKEGEGTTMGGAASPTTLEPETVEHKTDQVLLFPALEPTAGN